ncbi:hypothetical protein QBC34DRAFT_213162 [Podospora aff. communis PSN243]|uniref:NACHT domain-containing protein n=1 Tax=Podospora aff. communis PSN243 TaxID=3040156 RepID=A0AAV9G547_9PEZI|nr:hypothetical protein QBC34DRAFT_213162 [Podospora aff. communis PSN243]
MDPLSAIGLAGNIFTFIDIGQKVLKSANAIYSTASGATAENERLNAMSFRLNATLSELQSRAYKASGAKHQEGLATLAEECKETSQDLQLLLLRLRSRNPGSRLSSVRAALKDWWKADEKRALQQRLDGHMRELELFLSSSTSLECINSLNDIIKQGAASQAELLSLGENIKALHAALQTDSVEAQPIEGLRNVLELSQHATVRVRQKRVLDGLRFDHMSDRFDDVKTAHEKTFGWILGGDSDQDHDPNVTKARDDFIDWLCHGSRIFHIQGKPGAGKSTLMKYVCRHEKTAQYLKGWAGDKNLVLGKFFFWKPGSNLQKQLKGLIRGLLYSIMSASPDLIPVVFPDQWAATLTSPTIHFDGHEEIQQIFARLTSLDAVYREHKLVLFIDGLDEFEGDHAELLGMLKLFLDWTASRLEDLKICASSREWAVFQEAFGVFPKLRLQDVTRTDILTFVGDRLSKNDLFPTLGNEALRQRFLESIVEKAEGVFLWVALVLGDVEEGLLSGDNLARLTAKVNALPSELEDLILLLFNSIHPADRKEVYAILTLTDNLHNWPLLQTTFVEDYLEDAEFAMRLSIGPSQSEMIQERLKRARRKIYGKGKGLVEIGGPRSRPRPSSLQHGADQEVRLFHRSITEFLRSERIQARMMSTLAGFDSRDAARQTVLAHLRVVAGVNPEYIGGDQPAPGDSSSSSSQFWPHKSFRIRRLPNVWFDIAGLSTRDARTVPATQWFAFLDNIVDSITEAETKHLLPPGYYPAFTVHTPHDGSHTTPLTLSCKRQCPPSRRCITTLLCVFNQTFNDTLGYLFHSLQSHATRIDALVDLDMLVAVNLTFTHETPLIEHGDGDHHAYTLETHVSSTLALEACFSNGYSPNSPSVLKRATHWHYVIFHICAFCAEDRRSWFLPIVAFWLLMGGDPRVWLVFGTPFAEDGIRVTFECGGGRVPIDVYGTGEMMVTKPTEELRDHIKEHGPEIPLRTLVGMWYPKHCGPLQEAMDWMLERGGEVSEPERNQLKDLFEASLRPLISIDVVREVESSPPNLWYSRMRMERHWGLEIDEESKGYYITDTK